MFTPLPFDFDEPIDINGPFENLQRQDPNYVERHGEDATRSYLRSLANEISWRQAELVTVGGFLKLKSLMLALLGSMYQSTFAQVGISQVQIDREMQRTYERQEWLELIGGPNWSRQEQLSELMLHIALTTEHQELFLEGKLTLGTIMLHNARDLLPAHDHTQEPAMPTAATSDFNVIFENLKGQDPEFADHHGYDKIRLYVSLAFETIREYRDSQVTYQGFLKTKSKVLMGLAVEYPETCADAGLDPSLLEDDAAQLWQLAETFPVTRAAEGFTEEQYMLSATPCLGNAARELYLAGSLTFEQLVVHDLRSLLPD